MSRKFETIKNHADRDHSNSDSEDDDLGPNITDLGPVEYPQGEHKLQHPYCLWYSRRPSRLIQGSERYSRSLRLVGQVGTVEQWWALYSHIIRLQELPPHRDIHLFKKGIMPMWEDPANKKGGKWVIRLRKDHGSRAWENLCLAMLGEQFMAGHEICGVVVSTRYQECLLNIWNRTATDQMITSRIRDALKRLLNMPPSATMEYKIHSNCLKASKTIASNNTFKS